MATIKGFLKDWLNLYVLPITRGELVLDVNGTMALASDLFLAGTFTDSLGRKLPGLITAAERAMLTGGGENGGISDIYNKLKAINEGIRVNNTLTQVNFYSATGNPTPIILTATEDHLVITTANNLINFALAEINEEEITINNIVTGLTVDKHGRVTSATGTAVLSNEQLPTTLSGKSLSGCTTEVEDIGNENKAVANKYYVDLKFKEVSVVATGALKFGGPLSTANEAITKLNDSSNKNHYYKVITGFDLDPTYLYSETDSGSTGKIKKGDTLIIYPVSSTESKYVHVPSGDDITTITVHEEGAVADTLKQAYGHVTLQFGSVFALTNPGNGNIAAIDLPQASATASGYLSQSDYIKFSQYGTSLAVEYDLSILQSAAGAYQIGTIKIGGNDTVIYGLNNISKLTLNNGTVTEYDPILKFEETGLDPVSITYKGGNGIKVRKLTTGNTVEIYAVNEVVKQKAPGTTTDVEYLTITDGYKFGVKIGSGSGNTLVHGLTDYSEFQQVRIGLSLTTVFEEITNTLNDTTADFYYGSEDMKAALDVTI